MAASAAKWRQRARPQDDVVASHGATLRDPRVVQKRGSMHRKRAQGKPNSAGRHRAKKQAPSRPAASAGADDRIGKRSPIGKRLDMEVVEVRSSPSRPPLVVYRERSVSVHRGRSMTPRRWERQWSEDSDESSE